MQAATRAISNTRSQALASNRHFNQDAAIQLLLHCLSPKVDSTTIEQIKALAQDNIDWSVLIQLAKKHKVGPLFYHRLKSIDLETLPNSLRTEFRHYCETMTGRNLWVTFELTRLLALMAANDIDALPYKGPVLAQTLYKNLSLLRLFSDLDIVVKPQDMAAVEKLLMEEGYHPYYGKKTTAELAAYMKSSAEHSYDFYHDSKHIFIEVHWRFWPTTFSLVHPNDIWHRCETTKLVGKTVSNLIIEDYLIILCMHGSRHMWQRLSWLCDIAMLLHHYPKLDWQQVINQANQWGVCRMLYLGLYLAHSWLHAPLPDAIVQTLLTDSTLLGLAAQVEHQVFQEETYPKAFMATTQYQVRVRERWRDKAVYTQAFVRWLLKGCPRVVD